MHCCVDRQHALLFGRWGTNDSERWKCLPTAWHAVAAAHPGSHCQPIRATSCPAESLVGLNPWWDCTIPPVQTVSMQLSQAYLHPVYLNAALARPTP